MNNPMGHSGRATNPKVNAVLYPVLCMELPVIFPLIDLCATLLGVAGAILIIYGGFVAIARVILREMKKTAVTYNQIRRQFTDKIVFGLEFLIAADILATLLSPTEQDLINLAVVVVIRTILGYFLSKEAAEFSLQ
jgi:uncharacterized membrane protein